VGCGVWGVGCGVWGVGCGVWGEGCGVWGVGCGVRGVGCGAWGVWCGVRGMDKSLGLKPAQSMTPSGAGILHTERHLRIPPCVLFLFSYRHSWSCK